MTSCSEDGCPNAELLKRAQVACLKCPRGGRPAGHGGTVSADAAGEGVLHRDALKLDRSPRARMTGLPPGIEDATGELFRRWSGLDTVDALLALHLANGGTHRDFGRYLQRVRETIVKLDPARPAMRATAWAKFKSLCRRLPILEKVKSWCKGHGGAKLGHEFHFRDPVKEARRIELKAQMEERRRQLEQRRKMRDELQRRRAAWKSMRRSAIEASEAAGKMLASFPPKDMRLTK